MQQIILVAHIAVLGYWLGAELVINSEYRFICYRDDLPFPARDAMMDHLMNVDQHVRYALVLQLMLGVMLMDGAGYIRPGISAWALIFGIAWLALVETVHRLQNTVWGQRLAMMDRGLRYLLMAGLVIFGFSTSAPFWLGLKAFAFAGIIACGVGIRFMLISHFRHWQAMREDGPTAEGHAIIRRIYGRATSILGLLWLFIAVIVYLSLTKLA
jgi:hypothetical protein